VTRSDRDAGLLTDGGMAPDTDSRTADGMLWQEEAKLGDSMQNTGAPDGVAHDNPPAAADTLPPLAAAGFAAFALTARERTTRLPAPAEAGGIPPRRAARTPLNVWA